MNWDEVFSFSHVFKSFRMAIHPSKLFLALAAIALVYVGGWLLDGIWRLGGGYVQGDAIARHSHLSGGAFDDARAAWQDGRARSAADVCEKAINQKRSLSAYMGNMGVSVTGELYTAFSERVRKANEDTEPEESDSKVLLAKAEEDWAAVLEDAKEKFAEEVSRIEVLLDEAEEEARDEIKGLSGAKKDEASERLKNDLRLAKYALTARRQSFNRTIEDIEGYGIFDTFLRHEGHCLTNATLALCRGDIRSGLAGYQAIRQARREGVAPPQEAVVFPGADKGGVLYWLLVACDGCCWLLCQHWVFGVILLVVSLAVWSLFGGAIHRIAALQAAREEKISMRQALRFSAGKFFSFFTAPLIPALVIVIIGLLVALGGLPGNLYGIGALYLGLLAGLALLAGLVITFVTIGLFAGAGLMYPTIAVEGSDSFDAISRSFSYVFLKPWRALLYGLTALAHGVVCYAFVRGFALIVLKCTRFWADVGVWQSGQTLPGAENKLVLMWPEPTFASLHGPIPSEALTGMEYAGALLMTFWVYIVVGLVAAFVLSYASSATTAIYYLLRRKVDATDLDDVYVEEAEEEQPPAEEPEEPATGETEEPEEEAEQPPAEEETPSESQEDAGEGQEAEQEQQE